MHQRGPHVRIAIEKGGEHREVIPLHDPVRATLSSILRSVARHHSIGVEELLAGLTCGSCASTGRRGCDSSQPVVRARTPLSGSHNTQSGNDHERIIDAGGSVCCSEFLGNGCSGG